MQFRIILFIFLIIYIFSGVLLEYFQSNNSIALKDIKEQIIIDAIKRSDNDLNDASIAL